MTMGPIERISPSQVFWIIAASVVAGGVYIWPQTLVRESGSDGLWGLLLAIALAVAILWTELSWARIVPGQACTDRLRATWGALAYFWTFGTFALGVAVDGSILALFGAFLHIFFYPDTEPWVTRLLLATVGGWLACQSLPTLARNVQFWFPIVLLSFFFLAFLASPELKNLAFLRPDFPPNPAPMAAGALATWYLWIQGDQAVTLWRGLRGGDWLVLRRWATLAYLFQGGMLLLIWALVVGTLGAYTPQILEWPMPYIFANLGPESFFIARPGIFVLSTWAIAVLLYLAGRFFTSSLNLQLAFGIRPERRVWLVASLVLGTLVVSSLLGSPGRITYFVVHELDPLALVFMLARAGLSYLVATWRQSHGGLQTEESP